MSTPAERAIAETLSGLAINYALFVIMTERTLKAYDTFVLGLRNSTTLSELNTASLELNNAIILARTSPFLGAIIEETEAKIAADRKGGAQ